MLDNGGKQASMKAGPLEQGVTNIAKAFANLEQDLATLNVKLSPLLIPEPPQNTGEEVKRMSGHGSTHLVFLETHAVRLNMLARQVESLIARIEI